MITGVGTDMAEIARVQRAASKPSFMKRIFTDREQELIAARPVRVAGTFAAKEAVAKALGTGFSGFMPIDVEILRMPSGCPCVVLHRGARETAERQSITRIHVSITDTGECAQAFAVCESETQEKENVGNRIRTERFLYEPFVSAEGMRLAEQITIKEHLVPALVLMERAALAVVDRVKHYATKQSRIGVLCGCGNNGADGAAVARLLAADGYKVWLLTKDDRQGRCSSELIHQIALLKRYEVPIVDFSNITEYDIIVDALFGIGLSRDITGAEAEVIERVNEMHSTVIAVDIASGICANSGRVMGTALYATETVTFGAAKTGHLFYPGKEYTGELIVTDIGIQKELFYANRLGMFLLGASDEESPYVLSLPHRPNYSNKGTFGKVAVVGGSRNMAGAAYFSAYAAYRSGAGLVRIVTPECNRVILQEKLPEAMLTTYEESATEAWEGRLAKEVVSWADTLVIGPGLSTSEAARALLLAFLQELKRPENVRKLTVFDADALNLLAKEMDCQASRERVAALQELLPDGAILTPHLLELARLLDKPVDMLSNDLMGTARGLGNAGLRLQMDTEDCENAPACRGTVYVLKDAVTVVTQGEQLYVQTAGNQGMATGGSGDVLTGVIAALAAGYLKQGMETPDAAYRAATLAVYLHGCAGDIAAKRLSKPAVMAHDIALALSELISMEERERE